MKDNKRQLTEQELLSRLTALCSRAEHCSGEMREKMSHWGVESELQERVIRYLVQEKYVDDERFCRAFVNDKIKYSHWGRKKIELALWQKGIEKAISEAVLGDVDDAEYANVLRPLLKSKSRSIKAASEFERNQKLIRFAMSRGFEYKIIRMCVDDADDLQDD